MESKYIYPVSRIKVISHNLLSENQLERLLSAKSLEESFKVLQDTFLESFVSSKVSDISEALEKCLYQAKTFLSSIAPHKKIISMLWLEFDFFNLKTIIKGRINGDDVENLKKHIVFSGNYSFEKLFEACETGKFDNINIYMAQAVSQSLPASSGLGLDMVFDMNYLEALKKEAKEVKNDFVKEFVAEFIDLFNLKFGLRIVRLRSEGVLLPINFFVEGGKINEKDLENEEQILKAFKKLGNWKKWKDALGDYKKTSNFSRLEMMSEEHILDFLTGKSFDIFSIAGLFSYFFRLKNNLHLVRTVISGKELGLSELEIRKYLKKLY